MRTTISWPRAARLYFHGLIKIASLKAVKLKRDARRNEVFWNEILAPDEINRLTEPKVLTNFPPLRQYRRKRSDRDILTR